MKCQISHNKIFYSVVSLIIALLLSGLAWSADQAVPDQDPGDHSSLCTSDGSIRDDELADYVCSNIPKDKDGKPKVKDVKIMANSCYGGGLLDDFQRIFGPGGACAGVPWVAGSASSADEPSYGPSDAVVDLPAHKGKNLGDDWSQALAGSKTIKGATGAIRDNTSDNVKSDLERARDNDDSGPRILGLENPVIGTGNGGDKINWTSPDNKTKHAAVVFGGKQTNKRHHNNIKNVTDALKGVWKNETKVITPIDGGTKEELKLAIKAACSILDENTQLVLYFNDHGNCEFDFDEWYDWYCPYRVDVENPLDVNFPLHEGWVEGLTAMAIQPTDEPMPTLDLTLVDPIDSNDWSIWLNETEIPWPESGIIPAGDYQLPVDYTAIRTGENHLSISTTNPTAVMILNGLQLHSGPINEIEVEVEYEIGTIDDFESYTDNWELGEAIWQTWIDGLVDPNNGGSQVGYYEPPFAEQEIVHSGDKSMPFFYINIELTTESSAYRTFEPPMDWSDYDTLSMWIYGDPNNTGSNFFIQVNGMRGYQNVDLSEAEWQQVKFDLNSLDTNMESEAKWQQVTFDLNSLDTNMEMVASLSLGIDENYVYGNIFIDDIELSQTEAAE